MMSNLKTAEVDKRILSRNYSVELPKINLHSTVSHLQSLPRSQTKRCLAYLREAISGSKSNESTLANTQNWKLQKSQGDNSQITKDRWDKYARSCDEDRRAYYSSIKRPFQKKQLSPNPYSLFEPGEMRNKSNKEVCYTIES